MATEISDAWDESEGIDYSEAEQLVRECSNIDKDDLAQLPEIKSFLEYAESHDEWDSGETCKLPQLIIDDLDLMEKYITYRQNDDKWTVYGIFQSGEEDWAADVNTEYLAELLVDAMRNPPQASNQLEDSEVI